MYVEPGRALHVHIHKPKSKLLSRPAYYIWSVYVYSHAAYLLSPLGGLVSKISFTVPITLNLRTHT